MTVPPDYPAQDDGTARPEPTVSMNKPADPDALDFDPYRYGAPDRPVPPEYAPPGYRPQQPAYPPPPQGAQDGAPPFAGGPPPGYQPGPPPPYGMPYYAQPPRRSTGKAIASMVLGIGSIVLSILSVFDLVLIVLAVIFGILGLVEANRSPHHEGRGMAIAGLVCATIGTILAIVLTVWFVGAARDCSQYDSGSSRFQTCFRNHL